MKIILDENIPRYLKGVLSEYDVSTVQENGWAGTKNGELISFVDGKFDVLITADKNLRYQQNLNERDSAIVQIFSNRLPLIKLIEAKLIDTLGNIQSGQYVEVDL